MLSKYKYIKKGFFMKFYTYEKKLANTHILIGVLRDNPISKVWRNIFYLLRLSLVLYLFYFNAHYVHSKLLSLFAFILAIFFFMSSSVDEKLTSKRAFLDKVDELTIE